MIRFCKKALWANIDPTNREHVIQASQNLALRPGEDGLSVYKVSNADEAEKVATLWGLTNNDSPYRVDYLLVQEEVLSAVDLTCQKQPNPHDIDFLSERHYEVMNIDLEKSIALADIILSNNSYSLREVPMPTLKRNAVQYKAVIPELLEKMTLKWKKELERYEKHPG